MVGYALVIVYSVMGCGVGVQSRRWYFITLWRRVRLEYVVCIVAIWQCVVFYEELKLQFAILSGALFLCV